MSKILDISTQITRKKSRHTERHLQIEVKEYLRWQIAHGHLRHFLFKDYLISRLIMNIYIPIQLGSFFFI